MGTRRLARISWSLLEASSSSLEGNKHGRSGLLRSCVNKCSPSLSFGDASTERLPRTAFSRQADRRTPRNVSYGSVGASLAIFPAAATKQVGESRRVSTASPLRAGGSSGPKVKSLDHVVLTVKDIEATCQFYSEVLGMEVVRFSASDGGTRFALGFGDQKINLHQVGKEFEPKAHRATAGSADLCFITDTPLDVMQKHIESRGVSILQGPVGRSGALGAIRSVYFRDPDLNLIEVSNYV